MKISILNDFPQRLVLADIWLGFQYVFKCWISLLIVNFWGPRQRKWPVSPTWGSREIRDLWHLAIRRARRIFHQHESQTPYHFADPSWLKMSVAALSLAHATRLLGAGSGGFQYIHARVSENRLTKRDLARPHQNDRSPVLASPCTVILPTIDAHLA
jgi:hypothetical protein